MVRYSARFIYMNFILQFLAKNENNLIFMVFKPVKVLPPGL